MHEWTPKLSYRLFNMNSDNYYRIYLVLMADHNPGRRQVSLAGGIKESKPWFDPKGRKNEDEGFRPSVTHQGYEECL